MSNILKSVNSLISLSIFNLKNFIFSLALTRWQDLGIIGGAKGKDGPAKKWVILIK